MADTLKENLTEETTVAQTETTSEQVVPVKKMLALKIISGVLFGLVTIFMLWLTIDAWLDPSDFAVLGYFIGVIVWGSIGYGVNLILNATVMIISAIKRPKGEVSKGTLIYFIIFTVLPLLMWLVFFLLTFIFNFK